jgi:peptidyl-prolyl cis-trans isomerase C
MVTMSMDERSGGGPDLLALPADKVVLTIGEEKVTAGALRAIIDTMPASAREAARGERRRDFAEELVKIKLLAEEARRQKLDQSAAFQAQAAFYSDNLLAGAVFQHMVTTTPVDEKAARAWYDQHKSEFERIRARHILIRTVGSPVPLRPEHKDLTDEEALAKAKEIRKKLETGVDFSVVANNESDDTGSGANGGDLGFFQRGKMVPAFDQAVWAMNPGQISDPVRSPFGYHIIKVDQREAKSFDEVRPEVEKRLRTELAQQALAEKRKNTQVVFDPDVFKR